jgi:hypothetical protein
LKKFNGLIGTRICDFLAYSIVPPGTDPYFGWLLPLKSIFILFLIVANQADHAVHITSKATHSVSHMCEKHFPDNESRVRIQNGEFPFFQHAEITLFVLELLVMKVRFIGDKTVYC